MTKRLIVQGASSYASGGFVGLDGVEFLVDPLPRRIYVEGEAIEVGDEAAAMLLGAGAAVEGIGIIPLARPFVCPGCGQLFVNRGGRLATCDGCGTDWQPPAKEGEGT